MAEKNDMKRNHPFDVEVGFGNSLVLSVEEFSSGMRQFGTCVSSWSSISSFSTVSTVGGCLGCAYSFGTAFTSNCGTTINCGNYCSQPGG
jgi:hypothetical protein